MKQDDYANLNRWIADLSKEETNQRDLYLRKLATGEYQGPPVGLPSIDKPWFKSYNEEDIISDIPERLIYEDLKEYNKNNLNNIAIEYYGQKITYKELFFNIEKVASALVQRGIKSGDIVSLCLPYLPETVYLIYALNKIGAIVNMIDPRINEQIITEYINNANSKYAFIVDKIEDKIARLMPFTELKRVISISPLNSFGSSILRTVSKWKKSKFIKWNEFLNAYFKKTDIAEYNEEKLAVIEYTSGTSGIPKGVMLTNRSFNSLAHFQFQSLKNSVGDKFLLIMPPFIAYGLVIGMHDMLCQGQHLVMIPKFTLDQAPKLLPKLIKKHRPNYIMGVPNFLSVLMNYKGDLSFLKGMIVGGDHLDQEIEKRGRKFLGAAGLYKGWGMTEIASCGSFTKTDVENKIGSVGIPLSKNNVKVLKRKEEGEKYDINEKELEYNNEGILFVSSPAATLGYYKRDESTREIVYVDDQNRKWINTGDIFKIDEDGSLFFKGREKRIVVRPDGHNIPTDQIENIGNAHPLIDGAIVVGTPSFKYSHGSNATLCMSVKDNDLSEEELKKILDEIQEECKKQLQPRDRAKYFILVKDIPYTMNGKVDYNKLIEYSTQKISELGIDETSQECFYIIDDLCLNDSKVLKIKRK